MPCAMSSRPGGSRWTNKVKVARNAIMIWSQSHRNLGVGIPVPPLIDVEGLAGSAFGTAKKAVF